jgi:flagellar biogenesis protein FliO
MSDGSILKIIIASILLVVAFVYLFWLKKRAQEYRQESSEQRLRLVSTLNLSMKEKVVVVEIAHHQLVLGLNGNHIVVLADLQVKPGNNSSSAECLKCREDLAKQITQKMTF